MIHKFKVGDWFYDSNHCHSSRDYFFRITGLTACEAEPAYDVSFMRDTGLRETFRHWGDLSHFLERNLVPITNTIDVLRCCLSEARRERDKIQKELDAKQSDVDSLENTIELLKTGRHT